MFKIPSSLKLIGALGALFASAHSALALTWTDTSTFSPKYLSSGQSYSGTFDITDGVGGYNPAIHTITSAFASFAFADDSDWDTGEYVNVFLGNPFGSFISGQEVDGDHPSINYAWYGANVSGVFLADLTADGKLNWKVRVTSGDTYLKVAKLTAQGGSSDIPGTPDTGSTMALFALGLVGIAGLRRRLV
jgi:hypothetical protein